MTVYNLENILISILGGEKLDELMKNHPGDRANIPEISSENYGPDMDQFEGNEKMPTTDFDFNIPNGANNSNDDTSSVYGSVNELTDENIQDLNDFLHGTSDNQVHSNNPGAAHGEPHAHEHQDVSESHDEINSNAKISRPDMATALIRVPFGFAVIAENEKYTRESFKNNLTDTERTILPILYNMDRGNINKNNLHAHDYEYYMNFVLGLHDKVYGLSFLYWCDRDEDRKAKYETVTKRDVVDDIALSRSGFLKLTQIDKEKYDESLEEFRKSLGDSTGETDWDLKECFFPSKQVKASMEDYLDKDNTHGEYNQSIDYTNFQSKMKSRRTKIFKSITELLSGKLTRQQLADDYNLSFQKIEDTQTEQENYERILDNTGPKTFPAFASIDDLKQCRKEICGKELETIDDRSKTVRERLQKAFKNFYGEYKESGNFQPGSYVLVNKAFVDLPENKLLSEALFRMKRSQ